ncbi:uncharacterized protein [Watersipora subatra]|uniref:uncharacterized protein n=1 Tax=Watersipora subatra TaxID=2589382 RepID=UPI00355C02AF
MTPSSCEFTGSTMTFFRNNKRFLRLLLVLLFIVTVVWFTWTLIRIKPFGSTVTFHMPITTKLCVSETADSELTLATLHSFLFLWKTKDVPCRRSYQTFNRFYSVVQTHGEILIESEKFREKVRHWLGDNETLFKQVFSQNITAIYNHYTHEETLFNALRSKRPVSQPEVSDLDYIEDIQGKTKADCDFCRYKEYTAHDLSGRLENRHAVTAANTFRYDRMHQLILSRGHHPLQWSKEQFMAMFELAHQWLLQSYKSEPSYIYPLIMWDVLPHGGASQVHPHLQVVLKSHRYPGNAESWRLAAQEYMREHNSNYFTDLISVYDSLGLSVRYKSSVAIATLTPKKDNEIVIICKDALLDFYSLLYYVIRAYVDDMKIYPFSMALTLPAMDQSTPDMPAFIRIITRGTASEIRSDISSLELFSFNNVASDPYKLVRQIKASIRKRDV